MSIVLTEEQTQAVNLCNQYTNDKRIFAVSGQAGTGKTTIIKEVFLFAKNNNYKPIIVAFTGKAVKRITEATGLPAMTIHSLLEFSEPEEIEDSKDSFSFPQRHSAKPIDYNVVIIDEAAMVHPTLYDQLLHALPNNGFIRMFGDVEQLEPVKMSGDSVSPFKKALQNTKSSFTLTQVLRQSGLSNIPVLGNFIIKKDFNSFLLQEKVSDDVNFIKCLSPETQLLPLLTRLETEQGISFDNTKSQILTLVNVKACGVHVLNKVLSTKYNAGKNEYTNVSKPFHYKLSTDEPKETNFFVGDKVIVTQNLRDLRNHSEKSSIEFSSNHYALNGETGIIVFIDADENIHVDLGDRLVVFPIQQEHFNHRTTDIEYRDTRYALQLAYVLTTHKAQGSEFDNIIYMIPNNGSMIANRHNFYTALTRARKNVWILSKHENFLRSFKDPRKDK